MKSLIVVATLSILTMGNTEASGDACSDRVVTEVSPIFPRRCGEVDWASENMPCAVRLTYDLSVDGTVSNVTLVNEIESCTEYFFRSLEKSLMKMEFSHGAEETGCVYEYTFEFEQ